MASSIPCDLCEQVAADLMISNVHNGDTQGLCFRCLPVFAEAVTRAFDHADDTPTVPEDDGDGPGPDEEPEDLASPTGGDSLPDVLPVEVDREGDREPIVPRPIGSARPRRPVGGASGGKAAQAKAANDGE